MSSYLAKEAGYAIVELPQKPVALPEAVEAGAHALHECGEIIEMYGQAIRDRKVTAQKLRVIRHEVQEALNALVTLSGGGGEDEWRARTMNDLVLFQKHLLANDVQGVQQFLVECKQESANEGLRQAGEAFGFPTAQIESIRWKSFPLPGPREPVLSASTGRPSTSGCRATGGRGDRPTNSI